MRSKNSRQVARPPGHQKNHWGLETGNWRLSRGFTFIELLLSISILSIVMLAVYSAFALGINTYQRFNAVNLNERKVVLGLEKIGDELRQCLDFPDIGFEGNKEKLSFPVAADGQIVKINYSFDSEKNFLYRQEQTQREILKEEEPSEKESLSKEFLSSIEDLNFSYYYFDKEEEEYHWVDSYKEGLPLSVRIRLTFKDEAYRKIVSLPCAE